MNETNEKRVLLSLKNVEVKFNVRGRILTAIRNVSLDIYEHESLAIVGESGSGKSVLTKTFAGMLDSNGFIPQGSIIFSDDEISQTEVVMTARNRRTMNYVVKNLNRNSTLERGAEEYRAIRETEKHIEQSKGLTPDEEAEFTARIKEATDNVVDKNNYLQALSKKSDAEEYARVSEQIKELSAARDAIVSERDDLIKKRAAAYQSDATRGAEDRKKIEELKALRKKKIETPDEQGTPYGL